MKKILNKADISAALICLKGESQSKGALFTLRTFMNRHGLENSFRRAINEYKIYNVTQNLWTYDGLITPALIDKVFNFIKNDESDFKQEQELQRKKRNFSRISKTLKKYVNDVSELYIRTDVFSEKIPTEVLSKGISVGNGIYIINLKHVQEYESANAID